ncbi:DEAD/DEAH box helicase [Dactylosporangium roseum]|uniref:DEAD/DEAH box helicase n=1 Tax=Dactylosporangium roseum TaxID=47989 RepID=A0ABY5Z7Q5_9ACTN|nr:DEAD/DEAH box helicase [Dactylosporangium roseum]UWZ36419.1 DEAD/DEAH box helicase [Dactylosporangium roseum]
MTTTIMPPQRRRLRTPDTRPATAPGTFAESGLDRRLVAALRSRGLTAPFPIQAATLADALAGRDILGRGQTGSGKTLAFGLPLLDRLRSRRATRQRPLALVLVPTRELAQQVTTALAPYAQALGLRCATVVGGLSPRAQAAALARGAELLVATPGRLADLVHQGHCRLDMVEIAVVDEADQMADIGFLPQVTALLDQVLPGGQRMLFSATLDAAVNKLVRRFLADPVTHSTDPPAAAVTTMAHHLLEVGPADKAATVADIAARNTRTMMFVATKHGADRLARHLTATGLLAAAIHGGKSQGQRTRALEQFRNGALRVLVATNVAARGVHIDDLDLVVNVDPPADGKDYLHRGGRTARAGRSGTVLTLVSADQRRKIHHLMASAGIQPHCTTVRPGHPALAPTAAHDAGRTRTVR